MLKDRYLYCKMTPFGKKIPRIGSWISVTVLTSLLLCPSAAKAQLVPLGGPLQAPDMSEPPLWTSKPVRIDRARQNYERVAGFFDPYVTQMRIRSSAIVEDGVSFRHDGELFILSDVVGPAPMRLCRQDDGRRFACGGQARALLKKTIAGRYLECITRPLARRTKLADCRIGQRHLSEILVEAGYARATSGGKLTDLGARAKKSRMGFWADPACRLSDGC